MREAVEKPDISALEKLTTFLKTPLLKSRLELAPIREASRVTIIVHTAPANARPNILAPVETI